MSADLSASDLFATIADAIAGQPRSQQTTIGPSEIGTPCDRRLGHKLAATPEVNDRGVAWKPYIGTAGHEQLAEVFARASIAADARYLTEVRVDVGHIDGTTITGSCDLFDTRHGAVWDWKFATRNQIRENYRPHGPGQQYRTQAHLYGRGLAAAGHDVRTVGVVFLTRDGEFTDRHVWHEPYDEQVAVDALERATSIAVALRELGPGFTLPTLPATAAYCRHCDWYAAGATDLARACPGAEPARPAPATLADALT